jgi:hypothetical protein
VLDSKRQPPVSVKIAGRAFDDFSQFPAVLYGDRLYRCQSYNFSACIAELKAADGITNPESKRDISNVKFTSATSYFHDKICRMQWLPVILAL